MGIYRKCGLFVLILFAATLRGSIAHAEDSALSLERIVVSKDKSYFAHSYFLAPADLRSLSVSSPLEALRFCPVDLESRRLSAGTQTDFSIRGSTSSGVLVLVDGARVNDPQTAHHNSDIPFTKEDIESIQVIPGAAASLYGPDALGGAVNFVLKKPLESKKVIEAGGGSFKTGFGLLSLAGKKGPLGVRVSLEREESGGFRYDTDFKNFISSVTSVAEFPDAELRTSFGYAEKAFGAYDFYTPALGYPSKEWTRTYFLNTGATLGRGTLRIKPNFLWRRHYDKFMLDKTLRRSNYLNYHRTDMFTPSLYLQKETALLGLTGLGIEYGSEIINSTNLGKHTRAHKSVYADTGRDLTQSLSLGSSVRLDDYAGFNREYTGSLDLKYALYKGNSLRVGVSRNIRVPSFTELYYTDPITLGNPGLMPEQSFNYQAGWEYQADSFSLGVTPFLRQEKNMIDWVKRSASETKFRVENITRDEVSGMESYGKFKINRYTALDCNYTYADRRIRTKGFIYKYGQNYSRHLLNSCLSFNLPFGVQTVGFTYKKKPGRRGWLLVETGLSCDLNKHSQVFFKAENLLNVEYQEIEGIPQPGRALTAGLRFEW